MTIIKRRFLLLLAFFLFRGIASALTIMPVGDSITVGVDYYTSASGGYRDPLYSDLTASGVTFNFVGVTNGLSSPALTASGNSYHLGFGGYRIDQILNNLSASDSGTSSSNLGGYWMTGGNGTGRGALTPDIVLLNIGTNDVLQHYDQTAGNEAQFLADLKGRLNSLVTAIHTLSPNSIIFVAGITPLLDANKNIEIQSYNDYIQNTLVPSLSYTRYVDQYTGFLNVDGSVNAGLLGSDAIHPTLFGYVVMAQKWAAALRTHLGVTPTTYALTVNSGLGSGSYPAGSKITIAGNPPSGGSQFGSWSPVSAAMTNPYYNLAVYTMPAAAATLSANYVASGSPTIPNGTYQIANFLNNTLGITAASTAGGALVQQQAYSGAATQQWTLTNLGGNVVQLSLAAGPALEIVGGSTTAGANVDIATYTAASSQKWTINSQSYLLNLVNLNSGLGINNGYSNQAGTQLNQSQAGFGANQLWFFMPVSGGGGGSAPAAPTGLGATAGSAQVVLNWTAGSGATSYNVYRGTAAGGESPTPVTTGVTGTTYTNTGLSNGTAYYYKVAAVNSFGTSGYSNETSVTPTAGGSAPAAPTGLAATAGNTQVVLGWSASSGATSYNVYRGSSAGGESTTPIATGVTGTSYTNTGLSNGTGYYYKLAAVNSFGTSGYSNESSATPTAGGGTATFVNGGFEAPSITGHTYSSTGSSWTFANNAGVQHNGSAYGATTAPEGLQTGFVQGVSSTLGSMAQSVNFATAGSYTISFQSAQRFSQVQPILVSVDGIAVGTYAPSSNSFALITTASFTVTAGNHSIALAATDNTADKTSFIDALSIASAGGGTAPGAPTGLSATAGNALANLNWTASSGATSYNIYRGTTAGGESVTPIATGITGTTYSNTGLSNGTAYYYKVAAVSAFGTSGYSNEANATPTAGGSAPAVPTGLAATASDSQIALSWTASSGATSYNVYRGATAGGESPTAIVTGLTGTTYTNTGLSNGTAYYYKVSAINSFGTSGYSNESSATPTASGGGGTATFANPSFETPSVGNYTNSSAGTSWTFTNGAGIQHNGSAYSGSSVSAPDGTQTAFLQGAGTLGSMSQSVNFSAAGSYTISFQAAQRYSQVQPIQVSVDSTVVGTYTPASASFTSITTASFTVTSGNHTITLSATDGTADRTTFLDAFSITGGSGGGSVPAAPAGLAASAGNAQVVLTWSLSSGATSYNIYRGTTAGGESVTPIVTGLTSPTYTNSGLTNGTGYYYKVAAVNSSGTSAYSNEASATPSSGPNPPTALTATPGNAQVALSWTASSGATSYNVYRGTSAGGESSTPIVTGLTGTTYTNTGLTNGTIYYFKVAAVNASGTSGYSNEASASPTAGGGSATFANASFEAPSIGGYTTSSTGTSWTFANNAGIQHNGSAYSGSSAIAPDGTQTAFIQGSGSLGSMAQTVNFSTAGNYTITFQAAQRYGQVQPIQVKVDGTVVGTYTPASSSFASITTASFPVTSGNHAITFAATDSTADKSTFIDVVSIQ